jgi:hypothetical protein
MSKAVCAACRHEIDASARLCPYCGADPRSGEKPVDTQAILQEVFQPRHMSATEGVLEYARQRQGVVIAIAILVGLLLLAGVHQFIMRRNASAVSDASAVPLTEVTDLSTQPDETKQLSIPQMQFQYDGHPQTMSTFVVEQGAVAPPQDVIDQLTAEQQARHARAAAAAAAARTPPPTSQDRSSPPQVEGSPVSPPPPPPPPTSTQ